jgi:hypothetical protein
MRSQRLIIFRYPLRAILIVATLSAFIQLGEAMDGTRLRYYWNTGSIPPPDYYEYTIEISTKGGFISFRPDYPDNNPAKWQESFTVTKEQQDMLIQQSKDLPAINTAGEISVGGALESLKLVSQTGISKQVSTNTAPGGLLVDRIKKTVPERIWQKLLKNFGAYRDARVK